jgi:hypothetical protein
MRVGLFAIALLCAGTGSVKAYADTLNYTLTVDVSGSLNGVSFSNAVVTVTGSANTQDVYIGPTNNISNVIAPMRLNIAGVGTYAFTDVMQFFTSLNGVGIGDDGINSTGQHLLIRDSSVLSYNVNMTGSLAGLTGFTSGEMFPTTGGLFEVDSDSADRSGTFTATTPSAATPEPSSLWMLSTGVLGVMGVVRRRHRSF